MISEEVGDPAVRAVLKNAEELAFSERLREAGMEVARAIEMTATNAQADLAIGNPVEGPFSLQLQSMRLHYLSRAERFAGPAVAQDCREVATRYAAAARGQNWAYYKHILRLICSYYSVTKNDHAALATFRELLAYDPKDENSLRAFSRFLKDAQLPAKTLREAVRTVGQITGTTSPEAGLLECRLRDRDGKLTLDLITAWMDAHPDAALALIQEAVGLATPRLDPAKPEQLRTYCLTLARLALRQPGDEAHVATIAYLINEKKRIEVIMGQPYEQADSTNNVADVLE